jgi:hypothetical protein
MMGFSQKRGANVNKIFMPAEGWLAMTAFADRKAIN